MCGYESEETVSRFFCFLRFFKKKNVCMLKFERNVSRLLSRGGAKEQSLREEREKFFERRRREKINRSFFLKEFCRGEDEQKRRSFRGGRKKRVPKRRCIHEKHIIKLKWLRHCFDRAFLHIAKSFFTRRPWRGYLLLRLLFPMIPKETTTRKRVKL